MIRDGNHKYIHYVDGPPQLFDLAADPLETEDVATDPRHADVRARLEGTLRGLLDPEGVDDRAKVDQARLIESHGGRDAVLGKGAFVNSPVPGEEPRFVAGESDE